MTVGHLSSPPRRPAAVALTAAALVLLGACGGERAPHGDTDPPPSAAPKSPAPHDRPAGMRDLPDVTGLPLPEARDAVDAAGFGDPAAHDALGRDRTPILDGNWVVCFQQPPPGPHPAATGIGLGSVKSGEECPGEDRSDTLPAGGPTAPDLVGESVNVARAALGEASGVTVRDVSGEDRLILVESNWQVCAQSPAPGMPLDGVAAALDAVKFGETCP